eukprot:UN25374
MINYNRSVSILMNNDDEQFYEKLQSKLQYYQVKQVDIAVRKTFEECQGYKKILEVVQKFIKEEVLTRISMNCITKQLTMSPRELGKNKSRILKIIGWKKEDGLNDIEIECPQSYLQDMETKINGLLKDMLATMRKCINIKNIH